MPIPCTLLYAESNADLARQFQRRMEAHQMDVILAASDMAGISALSQHRVDLIVANYRLSGDNGLVVLRAARKSHPETAALLLVEPADLKHAGPDLRDERFDYLVKDADGVYLDMLPSMARRLVSQQKQQAMHDSLRQALEQAQALALEAAGSNEHGVAIFGSDLCLALRWTSCWAHSICRASRTACWHNNDSTLNGAARPGCCWKSAAAAAPTVAWC